MTYCTTARTLHSISNQPPPIHSSRVSCNPIHRAFRSQSHSSSLSCLFLLVRYVQRHKIVHQRVSLLPTEQAHQQKSLGLLQPPPPTRIWDELTTNFITHLPSSFGHTVILVVCDRLSKSAHFIALPTSFTAFHLANHFSVEIYRLHGIPKSIISNRDPLFLSNFWNERFHLQGTKLKFSTAYHPQIDGQTEVINKSLEIYLRCFTSDHLRSWYKYLHLVEFWYNSSYHSAIKTTPFQALYGRPPPSIPDYVSGTASEPNLETTLKERTQILHQLKTNLSLSQQHMAKTANIGRRHYVFIVGDWVLLR